MNVASISRIPADSIRRLCVVHGPTHDLTRVNGLLGAGFAKSDDEGYAPVASAGPDESLYTAHGGAEKISTPVFLHN